MQDQRSNNKTCNESIHKGIEPGNEATAYTNHIQVYIVPPIVIHIIHVHVLIHVYMYMYILNVDNYL